MAARRGQGSEPSEKLHVIIADDETPARSPLASHLQHLGCQVTEIASLEEYTAHASTPDIAAAVLEERLPDGSGFDLFAALRQSRPSLRAVMVTRYYSIASAVYAIKHGLIDYFAKPTASMTIAESLLSESLDIVPNDVPPHSAPRLASLSKLEWEYINQVLFNCDRNVTKAAHMLGVHRRTLQRKLARYAPLR